jgi:hypothetical protein
MAKTMVINSCNPKECMHCYDNEKDIYCAECKRRGLVFVFPKSSFKKFPKDCPLKEEEVNNDVL